MLMATIINDFVRSKNMTTFLLSLLLHTQRLGEMVILFLFNL